MSMNLLAAHQRPLLRPRRLHGNGCRFSWRMNVACAASRNCWDMLREEILAVVSRHVALDPEKVVVRMDRGKNVSTLEVDIELPNGVERSMAAAAT